MAANRANIAIQRTRWRGPLIWVVSRGYHMGLTIRDDFDFDRWLATSRPPSQRCIECALRHLALNREDLRSRLAGSLAILLYCDRDDIDGDLRGRYDAICEEVERRAGRDVGIGGLRAWLGRCKMATVDRLAQENYELDRRSSRRDV